ncbi:MAG: MBL fold metallo-hydrolase [Candidatus Methanoliparum thermophilum]|uniref:MBL fold metallo-hydrolase n=1 Tax=Methanoliparum thermophilum TaxID=2491083 RepID=A0A520KTV7_METT2|nr:MBL fold metallo-hydrolase [Candidatus Methanoliparum sp. LAM-1]RZN65480.1 MAG: MBL fold metallo-hydrolase [Candidatus Methanoliparum thermophilum]BDC35429.1 MBL fold hydrolase [Candidatus Methanoliparum sp. LAM-1]
MSGSDAYEMVKMKIITLSENTVSENSNPIIKHSGLGEWGLSILIEADDHKILFDTGASISTVHNADLIGIDLSKIDNIVLSHGHYDHAGGLRDVLKRMRKNVEIIAHPDVWASKYSMVPKKDPIYIGIPFQRDELESLGASFNLTREPVWITENIVTSGEIPMANEYEKIDQTLYIKDKEKNEYHPDSLWDDQAIFIKDKRGLIIILGCAHRGIINTVDYAKKLTGIEKIYAIVGGTHLMASSDDRLNFTIDNLKASGIEKLGVSHCTGMKTAVKLAQAFGDKFFFNNVGVITKI